MHPKRPLFAAVLTLIVLFCSTPALAQSEAFRYRPEKVTSGVVYHYTKSNRDGTEPWRWSLFVASSSRLDVLKWDTDSPRFVNVSADMDWTRFMPDHLEQRTMRDDGFQLVLWGRLTADGKALHISMVQGGPPPIPFALSPTHVWGFDLASLNVALRHLVDPTKDFEVGLIDPNKPPSEEVPSAPVRVGRMTVKYLGEETVNGTPCRKYALSGSALENEKGFMWVAKEGEHIVKVEHPVRTSTDWTDFKLELISTEPMTDLEWEKLKNGVIAGAQTKSPERK